MWAKRGWRFVAYSTESRVGEPIYHTDSRKGMRDQVVSLMTEVGAPYRYNVISVVDTVTGECWGFTGDSALNWRI